MPKYADFHKGITISKKIQNGFDDLENVDVHSEIGSLKCQKTLTNKTADLITAGCYSAVVPNGDTYFFSKTDGSIWKRSISDGSYAFIRTGVNGPYKGCAYYRNFLYYAMNGFLGRYDFGDDDSSPSTSPSSSLSPSTSPSTSPSSSLSPSTSPSTSTSTSPSTSTSTSPSTSISNSGSPSTSTSTSPSTSPSSSVSSTPSTSKSTSPSTSTSSSISASPSPGTGTWNDNFQVLTTGYPHPMFQFDLILYIGDGYNVASLDDAGVFSSSVLDQNIEDVIYALTNLGDDLLTLSNPGSYINDSSITRWNTYSDSWSYKDTIKQKGAYAFLDSDNYVHVVCLSGDIYLYNGAKLELFSNIRNAATTTGHQLTTNFQGKPLIANGGRIYSLHRKNRNLPFALVGEYTCSAGADSTIHSIVACGDQLLVSWENNGSYGIDEIDSNYYANARIITPRFRRANKVEVYYDDLNGGAIGIYSRKDGETDWTAHTVIDDSEDRQYVRTVDDMIIKSGGQALITITPGSTSSPVIDYINID